MSLSKKVYTLLLIISFALAFYFSLSATNSKKERLMDVLLLHVERISNQMERAVHVTSILKEITKTSQGYLTENDFNTLAQAVGDGIDYIAIQYMPEGVVKYAYPLAGNEATIGHNVLIAESTAVESQMAIEKNEYVVSGPFKLLQGMNGLAIRNPLYIDNGEGSIFWGFITIVLPVPAVLNDTGVFELEKLGYQFQLIAQYKNEDILFFKTPEFNEKFAQSMPITIGNTQWMFYLYVKNDAQDVLTQGVLLWAAFVLFSTFVYFTMKKVEYKLENDPLTGAYNRRVLDAYIKPKDVASGKKFVLLYIDLNDFKPVNDTYGHETGDRLLIAYVKRLQANIKSGGVIFRIGGDEFVIIVPDTEQKSNIHEMIKRIIAFSKERFVINGHQVNVSASIGQALFPSDGQDLKTLLQIADEHMYENKQAYKKNREHDSDGTNAER